jgi:hypothetical protein
MPESRHILMRPVVKSLATAFFLASSLFAGAAKEPSPKQLLRSLPLRFEQDAKGQWTSRGSGYAFLFDRNATRLHIAGRTVSLAFEGADAGATFAPAQPSSLVTNYFISKSYRAAAGFARLSRPSIYPGIDLVYYGNNGNLEYDFDLAPGADPSRISMRFDGADHVSINDRGEIVLDLGDAGKLVQQLPQVYQRRRSGELVAVRGAYRVRADGSIGVSLGKYNRAQPLVIDPSIVLTAYLAGSFADAATAIAHDGAGFLYLAGYTYSTDFVEVGQPVQVFPGAPSRDCWIMKLNPFASDPNNIIVYASYFGGELDDDLRGMTVDASGRMYIGGVTLSPDVTTTPNAYLTHLPNTLGVNSPFVAVIDPNQPGTAGLVYGSYFGSASATADVTGVANFGGRVYITGWTQADDIPLTSNAFQTTRAGGYEGYIAILDPAQTGTAGLYYSTYIGGTQEDVPRSITADSSGVLYVTGFTISADLITTANCLQPSANIGGDGFLTVINPASGAVVYSTFLGGSDLDVATKVVVEPSGRVAIAGYTFSTDFYTTANAAQSKNRGNADAFVTELDLTRPGRSALLYSTYYGGNDAEVVYDMRADARGIFYITGYTLSSDLPVTAGALNPQSASGGVDGFVAVISPTQSLVYGSYITSTGYQVAYCVDYDASGNVYVGGLAGGAIFPPGYAPKTEGNSNYDAFLLVFSISNPASSMRNPAALDRPRPKQKPRTGTLTLPLR